MFEKFKKRIAIKKAINHTELSIVERSSIVNEVTEKCFIDNDYHPEYVKPMFTLSVLRMFTIISSIMMKNEDGTDNEYVDVEKTYAYCIENHIMDYVVNKCKYMYIDDLFSEVCESIEFKKAMTISTASSVSDSIILSVTSVIDSVRKVVENFDPSQYKDVIELAKNANKFNVTKNDFINGIVNNLPKKEANKAEKVTDKVDNVTPIEG